MERWVTGRRVVSGVIGCIVFACASEAYAQQRAYRGSQALSTFGTVGQTSVQQGFQLGREGGAFDRPRAGNLPTGNYAGTGGMVGFGSRGRRTAPLAGFGAPRGGVYAAMANPLNLGLARGFAQTGRDYTGRATWARARNTRFGAGYVQPSPYMAIQQPRWLLYRNAFLAPVREARAGGRIRDDLTNRTLRNLPKDTKARIDPTVPRRSFSEMLETRMRARFGKRLQDGWVYFSEGRYQEAAACFEAAAARPEHARDSKLGMFFCEIASEQTHSALALVDRLIVDDSRPLQDPLRRSHHEAANPCAALIDLHALRRDWLEASNPRVTFDALTLGRAVTLSPPDVVREKAGTSSCSYYWTVDGGGRLDSPTALTPRYVPGPKDRLITLVATCDGAAVEYRQVVTVQESAAGASPLTTVSGPDRPWSEERLSFALGAYQARFQQLPNDPRSAVAYALLLWYSGHQQEAVRVAERVREAHRATKYSGLLAAMNGAMAEGSGRESASVQ